MTTRLGHITVLITQAKQLWARLFESREGEVQRDRLSDYRLTYVATLFALWAIFIFVRLIQLQTTALQLVIYDWALGVRRGVLAFGFAVLVAGLGLGFSVWKRKRLLSYSLSEIVFGCLLADHVGYRLVDQPALPEFLASASALYVIARGFSNLRDARGQVEQSISDTSRTRPDNLKSAVELQSMSNAADASNST